MLFGIPFQPSDRFIPLGFVWNKIIRGARAYGWTGPNADASLARRNPELFLNCEGRSRNRFA